MTLGCYGAIFWMWLAELLGTATKYVVVLLAMKFCL
ncbi:alanine:cation symporter family protein [Staphylococcus equorum]